MRPSCPNARAWRSEIAQPRRAEPSRDRKGAVVVLAVVLLISSTTGCASRRRVFKHPTFATEGDALRHLQRAMTDESPDDRRLRVDYVARTRYVSREPVVDALCSIARLDKSDSVRCSALHGLALSGSAKAAETCCSILGVCPLSPPDDKNPMRPASAEVREHALRATVCLMDSGQHCEGHREHLAEAAMSLLVSDRSRTIRLASAQVLGYCPDREVFEPLIGALRQRDFGVVYESERSLMRLTGKTFDHDPNRWEQWLRETSDPFADAGKLNHVVDRPEQLWGVRNWNKFKRTIETFKPQASGT